MCEHHYLNHAVLLTGQDTAQRKWLQLSEAKAEVNDVCGGGFWCCKQPSQTWDDVQIGSFSCSESYAAGSGRAWHGALALLGVTSKLEDLVCWGGKVIDCSSHHS